MLEQHPDTVKIVFKNFPLRNHRYAYKAALAALAADSRDLFWTFHDQLYQNHNQMSDAVISDIQKKLGLTDAAFEKTLSSPQLRSVIDRDVKEGRASGVRGTPTVFVNGKRFKERRNIDGFRKAIEKELAAMEQP